MRYLVLALVVLALLASTPPAYASGEAKDVTSSYSGVSKGWQVWQLTDDQAAPLIVHVRRSDARLPLVLFAAGSHCVPVFFTSTGGTRQRSTLPFDVEDAQKSATFHFAAVERKAMVPFANIDDVKAADKCTEAHGSVRRQDRVAAFVAAAKAFRTLPWVSEVLLAGHSEGADVAAGAAAELTEQDAAAGVGLFSGGGITQFYDAVSTARREHDNAAAEDAFHDLIALTGPNPPAEYGGFPKERFLSYAVDGSSLDDLRKTKTPVYVAEGTDDDHAPIASIDAMVAELLRDRQRSISYVVYEGLDHGFLDGKDEPHGAEVLASFVRWAATSRTARDVKTLKFPQHLPGQPSTPPPVRLLGLPPGGHAVWLGLVGVVAAIFAMRRDRVARILTRVVATVSLALALGAVALQVALAMGVHRRLPILLVAIGVGSALVIVATRRRTLAPKKS